jgi:TPR repeat protein
VDTHGVIEEPETSYEILIGQMYEYGEAVAQDYATALHWYQIAAGTGDTAAMAGMQRVEDRAARPERGF